MPCTKVGWTERSIRSTACAAVSCTTPAWRKSSTACGSLASARFFHRRSFSTQSYLPGQSRSQSCAASFSLAVSPSKVLQQPCEEEKGNRHSKHADYIAMAHKPQVTQLTI